MHRLVILMETHKEEPEALFDALERFIADEGEAWAADKRAFDELDEESQERLVAVHADEMQEVSIQFLDLSLEIQDRLADKPEELLHFLDLLEQLGQL